MIDPDIRAQGIGCSELAVPLGRSQWKTPWELQMEKLGLLAPRPPSERAWWGSLAEPLALDGFEKITGKKLIRDHRTRKHPEWPVVYTLDATIEGESAGVDAKWVAQDQAHKLDDGLPPDWLLQGLGYMECCGFDRFYFAICVGGQAPIIAPVERDPALQKATIRLVSAWWQRHIVDREELPIDGSDTASAWLQQTYPRHKMPDMRRATPEEIEMLEEYEALCIIEDEASEQREELKNQIKARIKDREGLEWPGGKFTWRKTKDSKIVTTDWESMAKGLRHQFLPDPAEQKQWEEFYTRTVTKEGYRRVYFRSQAYQPGRKRRQESEDAAA